MPETYHVKLSDGREFNVTTEGGAPSESDVLAHLDAPKQSEPAAAAPVDRGGLRHPLTSLIAPELEGVRGKIDEALATPHGTPIMARSRTGALYQSETGTGAINAAKNGAKGFAGSMIEQAESATSPLGIALYGASKIPVAPVANAAASVLENVPAAKSLIPFANPAKNIIPFEKMAGRLRTIAQTSQDAGMGVTRGADMYEMPRFPRSTESTARVPMMHGEPAEITDAMRAQWAMDAERVPGGSLERLASKDAAAAPRVSLRERFPNGLPINAPEAAPIQPIASHGQAGAIRTTAQPSMMESAELRAKQILPDVPPASGRVPTGHGSQPDNLLETLPDEPVASAMQQPRVDVGAERVGRAQGLSKEQVRAQTAPILGEVQGAASPILPQKALNNIIDAMKALPKEGGAREAYVQAATSGKAQWQIENIRRTLEHLGLLVPAAAAVSPDVRGMLLSRMRSGVTGRETAQ